MRRRVLPVLAFAAGVAYVANRPHGAPWLFAGFAIGVAWRIWDISHRDARLYDAAYADGRSAGQVAQLEELDRLCELDPQATAVTALDHLDAIYARDLTKETP